MTFWRRPTVLISGLLATLVLVNRWRSKRQSCVAFEVTQQRTPRVWCSSPPKGSGDNMEDLVAARFARCLFHSLQTAASVGQIIVNYKETIKDGEVVVCLAPAQGGGPEPGTLNLPLGHASLSGGTFSYANCPANELESRWAEIPSDHRKAHIGLAACVLLEDCAGRVLLLRRAAHMRTFPGAWVLPGGGVDPGEGVAAAAARELWEEAGVRVAPGSLRPVGLWESCYPTTAAAALSQAPFLGGHHLVVFLAGRLGAEGARAGVRVAPEESDAHAWAAPGELRAALLPPPPPGPGGEEGRGGGGGGDGGGGGGEGGATGAAIRGVYREEGGRAGGPEGARRAVDATGLGQGHAFILNEYFGFRLNATAGEPVGHSSL